MPLAALLLGLGLVPTGVTCTDAAETSGEVVRCRDKPPYLDCETLCGGTEECQLSGDGRLYWGCTCDRPTTSTSANMTSSSSGCWGPFDCGPCPFNGICKGGGFYDCSHCKNCDLQDDDCFTCRRCQLEEWCKSERAACAASPVCNAYANCFEPCTDQACVQDCAAADPEGEAAYEDVAACTLTHCGNSC